MSGAMYLYPLAIKTTRSVPMVWSQILARKINTGKITQVNRSPEPEKMFNSIML
jgi:hypothetical protein